MIVIIAILSKIHGTVCQFSNFEHESLQNEHCGMHIQRRLGSDFNQSDKSIDCDINVQLGNRTRRLLQDKAKFVHAQTEKLSYID